MSPVTHLDTSTQLMTVRLCVNTTHNQHLGILLNVKMHSETVLFLFLVCNRSEDESYLPWLGACVQGLESIQTNHTDQGHTGQ